MCKTGIFDSTVFFRYGIYAAREYTISSARDYSLTATRQLNKASQPGRSTACVIRLLQRQKAELYDVC